jgi:hypothetical protein
MRIFAASFLTEESAVQALEALDRQFRTSSSIRIAPFGHTGGVEGPSMLLAGRFENHVIDAARVAIAELGGTVLVDAEERPGS